MVMMHSVEVAGEKPRGYRRASSKSEANSEASVTFFK
jgi:hypothetical protein